MILLELFSGIGGFSKGFEKAGYPIEQTYFSEIDKHAIANFKYNFPHAQHIGPVEKIATADIPHPDILTFGSPCQDFSDLGKEPEWQDAEVPLSATQLKRFGISDLTFLSGKMLRECSSQSIARISSPYLKRLPTLGVIDSNGNCLIRAGFYPRIESGYTLSGVLQSDVPEAFFLSEKSIEKMVKHGYTRVLVLGR